MRKLILFGSGNYGRRALKIAGKGNVAFFIDNNEERTGQVIEEIAILSFSTLKKIKIDNYYIVISASDTVKFDLAEQLIDNGISQFIFFDYLEDALINRFQNYLELCQKSIIDMVSMYRCIRERLENQIAGIEDEMETESVHLKNNIVEQNENQKNKSGIIVEFYLIDAFEIFHFEKIYYVLRKHNIYARYVAESTNINTSGEWFDYRGAKKILRERNLEYTEHCNIDADIVFTTQLSYVLRKYRRAIKINMTYGCSMNKDGFWFQKRAMKGFDYKFVGGQFIKDKCLVKNILDEKHIKVIGSPKYYDFYSNKWDKAMIYKELGINTNKPTLVYFPTWDEDSSILRYKEQFIQLKEKFFIITKSHHCTYRLPEKHNELTVLFEISDVVLEGNYDFEKAAILGDVRICDAKSGAALECCFLNNSIPTIFLTVRQKVQEDFYTEMFDIADAVVDKPQNLIPCVYNINANKRENKDINYYFDGTMNEQRLWECFEEILKEIIEP